MSLDLYYKINPCPHCGRSDEEVHINVTYNLTKMWMAACPEDTRLIEIDDMTGAEAKPKLERAFRKLMADPEKYKQYEPENGWGTYAGLLDKVNLCITFCKDPGIWMASR